MKVRNGVTSLAEINRVTKENGNLLRAELRKQGITPIVVKPKPKPLVRCSRQQRSLPRTSPSSAARWRR
jgi:ubiquinone/menaquinone biosynthesis C-methylase UbiE